MMKKLSHKRPLQIDRFYYGSPYYPEHWDVSLRAQDPEWMAAAGWNMVRMAEFAWDLMEPREGEYDFSLFDETIQRMGEKGIVTMLCTPTATPPRWLTYAHPEMLGANEDGIRLQHGSRQQACYSSPVLREYSRRITHVMAEHFKDNPHVIGWQTDNEINCQFPECHCPNCQDGFREFLRQRYGGDIDGVNQAWGVAFWAQTYSSFEQIETPKFAKPIHPNPSQVLDYHRFLSWRAVNFQHDQVKILRQVQPRWFVTHNGLFRHIDYRGQFTRDLDFIGYDVYPFFNFSPATRPLSQAFNLDQARAWSGNFMVPEQQSGPGGQGNYFHDTPEPGEMLRMAYTSIARGADGLLFFRWRTARFGAEEYWCGILNHDSVPRRRYAEAAQLGEELTRVGPAVLGTSVVVNIGIAAADQEVTDAHQPMTMGLPGPDQVAREAHAFFLEHGYAVGCVHPSDDLDGLSLYIIPHWGVFDPNWVPALAEWVQKGGVLLVGARTASKDMNNHVVPETLPGVLAPLTGVTVEEYGRQNAPDQRPLWISFASGECQSQLWYEVLQPQAGEEVQVLANWKGRSLNGLPAITAHRVGKGCVIYAGSYLTGNLLECLLPEIEAFQPLVKAWPYAPAGVQVVCRQDEKKEVWFFINTSDAVAEIELLPENGFNLIANQSVNSGPHSLTPNEVLVIQKAR